MVFPAVEAAPAQIAPKDARAEQARRELARRTLVGFSRYIAPYYRPARHHKLVGRYLEQVELYIATRGREGIGRLLIFEPPRHGKSEQASRHFPAWVLGRNPDMRVIVTSYGLDLASKFSRAARDIVMGAKFAAVFGKMSTQDAPVEISSDSRSVQSWDLASPHRGGLTAAGVGGGITGLGANLFIVDDPFKNRQEAESESQRDLVWEWWTSTAYTRLEDGAAVVGMLTRWHGDDWAGRLLRQMAEEPRADRWVVVCLPAVWEDESQAASDSADKLKATDPDETRFHKLLDGIWYLEEDLLGRRPGEALWPEKYDFDDLESIRHNVGPYDWEALYQQRPYAKSGNFFQREWFTVVDKPPAAQEIVRRVRYWDKAGTGGGGAFTAGVCLCETSDGLIYVEDVARQQYEPSEREKFILITAQTDAKRPGSKTEIYGEQEPGSAGKESAQHTTLFLAKHGFGARFEQVSGDKETRAEPWSGALRGGGVRLVRAGWNRAYIDEHVGFPKGRYKDQVDASSGGYSKLTLRRPQRKAQSYQG